MKTISILLLITLFSTSIFVSAQENLKIGHVNIPEIMQQLPETDSLKTVLENETKDMEKMYEEMITEHEASIKEYEQKKASYSEFVKNEKEKSLMEMANKIQQFNQNANQQLQQRNMELLQPVYQKINAAIEKIALSNHFTYILDLSNGAVAFYSPNSENINPLVLKELNITNR